MTLIIVLGIVESFIVALIVFAVLLKKRLAVQSLNNSLKDNLSHVDLTKQKVSSILEQLVPFEELKLKVKELTQKRETLKLEKGRLSVATVERETIDRRLRELEEIERELEASNIEVKKELDLLEGRQKELQSRNASLNLKIQENTQEIEKMTSEALLEENIKKEMQSVQEKLLAVQAETEKLTEAHNVGKNQYSVLKRRFDALDIEYAQLYEKFVTK
ncbi:MAG: hypothetical protein ACOX3T_01235 [Bdellovibrionota bacterium]